MARRNRRGFGALRKLPSGKWQASYLSPSGERKQAPMTFGAWIDVAAYLSAVRYEMEKGIWVDEDEKPVIEEHLENLQLGSDESAFVRVHDDAFLKAKKCLYMTATPRIYAEQSKQKAADAALARANELAAGK